MDWSDMEQNSCGHLFAFVGREDGGQEGVSLWRVLIRNAPGGVSTAGAQTARACMGLCVA